MGLKNLVETIRHTTSLTGTNIWFVCSFLCSFLCYFLLPIKTTLMASKKDPTMPGTCAEYEGGMCEAFVPIGSRIFVPGNVSISYLDSRADRFILSTSSFQFLPARCR